MRIPTRAFAIVLLVVLLGCAGGSTSKPESAVAPGADFAAYQTFGWQSASGGPIHSEPPPSIRDAGIYQAIRTQLIEKGYRETEGEPDFRISYETESYTTERQSSPVRIGVGVGSWGGNVGGGVGTSVPVGSQGVVATRETRLTIRAVDPNTNRELWIGTTTGDLGQGLDSGVVEKAVASTMKEFPSRRK